MLLSKPTLVNDIFLSPGSAGSLAKSMNGSLRSELSGHGCDVDGDNINVVIRVRPISTKESKANDESIIQFPGEGQIWVIIRTIYYNMLNDHLHSRLIAGYLSKTNEN